VSPSLRYGDGSLRSRTDGWRGYSERTLESLCVLGGNRGQQVTAIGTVIRSAPAMQQQFVPTGYLH
jgi:hypothetical protein